MIYLFSSSGSFTIYIGCYVELPYPGLFPYLGLFPFTDFQQGFVQDLILNLTYLGLFPFPGLFPYISLFPYFKYPTHRSVFF